MYNRIMLPLELPIENLPRISKYFVSRFKKMGVKTIRALLYHFPTRYDDFSEICEIANLVPSQTATIQGKVKTIKTRQAWKRRRMQITEAKVRDGTGEIEIIWFNQSYVANQLKPETPVSISGKISQSGEKLQLKNPTFEILHDWKHETTHTGKLVAKYPETQGMTSKGIRHFMDLALRQMPKIEEPLPNAILRKLEFQNIQEALCQIHQPDTIEDANQAQKRFSFEDLFYLQVFNLKEKQKLKEEKASEIPIDIEKIKSLLQTLPFELTTSQKAALWEIVQDLGRPHPMNRLLQGDVGSGKTIVVALAALLAAEEGYQVAFMAPTEILARQHFETMKKFFPETEEGLALLTASEAKIYYGERLEYITKKPELKKQIEKGEIKIIFGTHALIQKDVSFRNLALVVVDEQHRFGVRQRAELIKKYSENLQMYKLTNLSTIPHFLSMSATPIPRTLSLTLWGDLDLSLIHELPKDRQPITTKVMPPNKRGDAYSFIRAHIKEGRQAFVVCPRIKQSEDTRPEQNEGHPYVWKSDFQTLEVKSVIEEHEKLSKKVFPDLKVAMLHGKMKPKEKEEVMRNFKDGKSDVLVSTSVIEVGVDVPNATIMLIESADRFGLAQLYQFRGRVGRGAHKSYCLLLTESSSKSTAMRLQVIEKAKNGMELAEYDLKTRGPGEFLGEVQTGMPDLAMKALKNPDLVKDARYMAKELLEKDPELENHPLLVEHLKTFQSRIHWE